MSSDLLAEFDSFYRAPQSQGRNSTLASDPQSTSALDDLSFFKDPTPTQNNSSSLRPQSNIPVLKPTDIVWGNFNGSQAEIIQQAPDAPDPWGSFEPPKNAGHTEAHGHMPQKTRWEGTVHNRYKASIRSAKPGIIRASTEELFSENIADLAESTAARLQTGSTHDFPIQKTASQYSKNAAAPKAMDDVLFDADELGAENDDDFGDFETVSSTTPQIDLLQIESPLAAPQAVSRPNALSSPGQILTPSPFPYPQAPKSPSFQERNYFADLALTTTSVTDSKKDDVTKTKPPVTAWPVYEPQHPKSAPYHDSPAAKELEDEDWGDFADLPSKTPDVRPSKGIEADTWAWDAIDNQSMPVQPSATESPPPTNIPPPSVLLAIFPQLFNLPQSSLFRAVANQPFALKNRILSDPSTIDFLRAYILIATVAARIIAGRKLRWKRDTHLSQAMKIGPAAAGGRGGMKLTGVDKAESMREEREVADLVRVWREQVGRLRSAVAAANSSLHDHAAHLAVPEITDAMQVKAEGVLTAPKACILCGLRREERIAKVDFKVEDSFGEWWVEHWGHRACRNFWQEHESKLKQR